MWSLLFLQTSGFLSFDVVVSGHISSQYFQKIFFQKLKNVVTLYLGQILAIDKPYNFCLNKLN